MVEAAPTGDSCGAVRVGLQSSNNVLSTERREFRSQKITNLGGIVFWQCTATHSHLTSK